MNKIVVFDFMRTLYDPDTNTLIGGAKELLTAARDGGYTLILWSKTGPRRNEQIEQLGIAGFFERIELTDEKTDLQMQSFLDQFEASAIDSFVIGDRAQKELLIGHRKGMKTIWYACGKFVDEAPQDYEPTFRITDLWRAIHLVR